MLTTRWLIFFGAISFSILCWFFPLFHIRAIDSKQAASVKTSTTLSGTTEATGQVARPRTLEALASSSVDLKVLFDSFESDASKAKAQHGRQASLGGASYFCVRGQGSVDSVEKSFVVITIDGIPRRVRLDLNQVFDNTVRESVGIKASDFKNSQEFNAVSDDLNRQVEENVIAVNREKLTLGAVVTFVGCTKIGDTSDLDSLSLIPIQLNVSNNDTSTRGSSQTTIRDASQ